MIKALALIAALVFADSAAHGQVDGNMTEIELHARCIALARAGNLLDEYRDHYAAIITTASPDEYKEAFESLVNGFISIEIVAAKEGFSTVVIGASYYQTFECPTLLD